jgi:RHS repeat-associated protein
MRASILYQNLMWVGSTPPSEEQTLWLWTEVQKMKKSGVEGSISALEQFATDHPDSPWVPSILANLGRYDFEQGLYSKALQHWETAWNLTRHETQGAGKKVGDFTFVYWTRLLASLGRVDALKTLFEETRGRVFDGGSLQQLSDGPKQGYHMMLSDPGLCFKCGTYALANLGKELNGGNFDFTKVRQIPSPTTGFTMSALVDLAQEMHVDVVAVKWGTGRQLVVPSVVHWKQNHYAAIIKQRGSKYLVVDPTFGSSRWLDGANIAEEASGKFLIPTNQLGNGWVLLDKTETDNIFGRGYVTGTTDPVDGCKNGSGGSGNGPGGSGSSSGPGGGHGGIFGTSLAPSGGGGCSGGCSGSGTPGANGNGSTGGTGAACGCPSGMAVWEVSEPYINLWLYDKPIVYRTGFGEVEFTLTYKQREGRTISEYFFGMGGHWDSSLLSYVIDESPGSSARMEIPGGGERTYIPDGTTHEFYSHTTLLRTVDDSNNLTGFVMSAGDGSKAYYQFVPTQQIDAHQVALLTAQVDPSGHTNKFLYSETNDIIFLTGVVDVDGRTSTLEYTNVAFPNLVTAIVDPFGRTARLQYNELGLLTNIVDPVGLPSSFLYDARGWVTNLHTQYGNTSFEHFTDSQDPANEFNNYNAYVFTRALRVIDAAGGTNVYMLRQASHLIYTNATDFYTNYYSGMEYLPGYYTDPAVIPDWWTLPAFPDEIYDFITNSVFSIPNQYLDYRNSFHWNPRQAASLPSDLYAYTVSDFVKASRKHWLHEYGAYNISQTLSLSQDPSPDGIQPGQITWYGYVGPYGDPYSQNPAECQPGLVARVLPDQTTAYTWYRRDGWGHVTNKVETYSMAFGATPLLRTNVYVYDANGIDLVMEIGPRGETKRGYYYDAKHHVLRSTNAVGDVMEYTYDATGRLTKGVDPAGLTTTNIYFASGSYSNWLQTTIEMEIGRTNAYTYTNNLVWTHTDERGNTTTNAWDNLNRLTGSSDLRGAITYTYDKLDLVRVVDRMGFTNTYGYDNVRRKTAETNALGNYTLYLYCSCGALDSIRDMAGNFTLYHYDNAGRRVQTVGADGYALNYNYNLMGQATNVADNGGYSVTNWFNNQGLEYAVSNAFGQVKLLAFDIEDRTTNAVDANGVTAAMQYDDLDRLSARSYPDGGIERFGYTARGLVRYTNQLNLVTLYEYDEAQRKVSKVNANLETNRFSYSPASDLLTLTDAKSQTTSWNYDRYGRVTNKVDTLNNPMFVYTYDAENRLGSRWTPAKGTTTYFYDKVGNLTNITYPVSPAITLRYDKMNRLTNMVDGVGTTVYGYDAVGQLLSEDGPWTDDTVSYSYNNRLRTGLNLAAPNASAWVQTYGYDSARRMTNITSPAGGFAYVYDPQAHQAVGKLFLPNGAYITNAYDNLARTVATTLKNSVNGVLDEWDYFYNQGNQRVEIARTDGSFVNYAYDKIGQLKAANGWEVDGMTPRAHEQFGYGYDAAGNLHLRTNNALVQTFNVNSLNELTNGSRAGTYTVAGTTRGEATSVTVNASAATLYGDHTFASTNNTLANGNNTFTAAATDGYGRTSTDAVTAYLPATNSFVYDANGNLTSDGQRNFAYDDENQLISVWVTNAWRSDFVYDGKKRRRFRFESKWLSSTWVTNTVVRYIYDGNLVIQERDANSLPSVTYTRGKDLSGSLQRAGGINGLLMRTDNHSIAHDDSEHAFYHADANGNITCMINRKQVVGARYLYDPFGNVLCKSGSLADLNLYRFSSKEFHPPSGLSYYLYRYYMPEVQKWLTRDPIGERGSLNLFEFVVNSPLERTDADGLNPILPPGIPFPAVPSAGIPEPDWDRLCCLNELRKQRKEIMGKAASEARANPYVGGIGFNGGPEDAMRHCLGGCYLARAMEKIPKCKGVKVKELIEDEENHRSSRRTQTDIDNSMTGAGAPAGSSCADFCNKAWVDGKLPTEDPAPWPIIPP